MRENLEKKSNKASVQGKSSGNSSKSYKLIKSFIAKKSFNTEIEYDVKE